MSKIIDEIEIYEESDGLIVEGKALDSTIPTTAGRFIPGCKILGVDGKNYVNSGTTAVPVWQDSGEIVTSEIADQAITMVKLVRGTNGQIIVANTGANPAYVSMSGDITMDQTGATTIGAGKVGITELESNLNLTGSVIANISIPAGTPVNAVAANKLLTIGTNPINQATVSLGGVTYRFMSALGAGVAATGTLTMNTDQPHDGDTITTGGTTYIFKTALSAGPTVPNEILIDDTTEHSMDNLIAAIEGAAGEGTKYSVGTVSQGAVTATKATADTMLVTYDTVGFLGNQYDTLQVATHATWGALTLTGGIDAQAANDVLIAGGVEGTIDNLVLAITAGAGIGTNYGTGTVVNPLATAVKASAATMTATNKIKGVIGNSTAIDETLADGSWAAGATALSGGVDGTVGSAREMYTDSSYLYMCIAANSIADANWRRVTLGTAY